MPPLTTPSFRPLVVLLLGLGLSALAAASCRQECKDGGDDPAAAQILQFRRELADNDKHPIRGKELAIDQEAFAGELAKFLKESGGLVLAQLNKTIEALPTGLVPSAPVYKRIAAFEDAETMKAILLNAVTMPDIKRFFRTMFSGVFPLVLRTQLGLATAEMAGWLGFLALAEPEWRVCGKEGASLSICADCGGLDVFMLQLAFEKPLEFQIPGHPAIKLEDGMWVPKSLAWWRKV